MATLFARPRRNFETFSQFSTVNLMSCGGVRGCGAFFFATGAFLGPERVAVCGPRAVGRSRLALGAIPDCRHGGRIVHRADVGDGRRLQPQRHEERGCPYQMEHYLPFFFGTPATRSAMAIACLRGLPCASSVLMLRPMFSLPL